MECGIAMRTGVSSNIMSNTTQIEVLMIQVKKAQKSEFFISTLRDLDAS